MVSGGKTLITFLLLAGGLVTTTAALGVLGPQLATVGDETAATGTTQSPAAAEATPTGTATGTPLESGCDRRDVPTDREDATAAPPANDSDGDGLGDRFELRWSRTDPRTNDSDGDGTPDPAEDSDTDTLDHAAELASGTDPSYADVDADGLTDPQELANGTDPAAHDSDADHLDDGTEVREPFCTDPLDDDTDDDGVLDGNETYTTTTRNEQTGVVVSTTGPGDVAADVEIRETSQFSDGNPASAGPTVLVSGVEAATDATVTIPIAPDSRDETNLTVFVRPHAGTTVFESVPTTVDRADGTASAAIETASYVTVLNGTAWRQGLRADVGDGAPVASYTVSCGENCETDDGSLVLGDVDGENATSSDG